MWLRELGVKVTIDPFEQKTWIQNQQTLTHTIALMGWTADFPDPITFLDVFKSDGGNNWTGWKSKDYDALLEQAASTADPAARFALLQKRRRCSSPKPRSRRSSSAPAPTRSTPP